MSYKELIETYIPQLVQVDYSGRKRPARLLLDEYDYAQTAIKATENKHNAIPFYKWLVYFKK